MNSVRIGTALCALIAVMLSAHAGWTGSAAYRKCIKAAGGSDASMTECTRDELERVDKRLNASYVTVMQAVDGERKEAIRASQKAWVNYRDLTCEVLIADGGGTFERAMRAECEVQMTGDRADWLAGIKP